MVGIGFLTYQQPLEKKPYQITHQISANSFFGDHYLCSNTNAEFLHVAETEVEAFALTKDFLMNEVFPKYPIVYRDIRNEAKARYNASVKDEVLRHKSLHLELVNRRSAHKSLTFR